MDNHSGRTIDASTRPADIHPTHGATSIPSPLLSKSLSPKGTLYPIPNIPLTNLVKLKHAGDIEGMWAIDSRMKIPEDALQLHSVNYIGTELHRENVDLYSEKGGIIAKIYLLPGGLFIANKVVTIRMETNCCQQHGGGVRLVVVSSPALGFLLVRSIDPPRPQLDAWNRDQGKLAMKFRRSRPPVDIKCSTRFGDVTVALPRSFRGSISLNGSATRESVFEYSAAIKEQLSITTAVDAEHRGFIGSPGKVKITKDQLEVDCIGRIYVCYDYEEIGLPDSDAKVV